MVDIVIRIVVVFFIISLLYLLGLGLIMVRILWQPIDRVYTVAHTS